MREKPLKTGVRLMPETIENLNDLSGGSRLSLSINKCINRMYHIAAQAALEVDNLFTEEELDVIEESIQGIFLDPAWKIRILMSSAVRENRGPSRNIDTNLLADKIMSVPPAVLMAITFQLEDNDIVL